MTLHTKTTQLPNDPLSVFSELISQHDNCFLLETLADKHQPLTSGQSYIGVSPSHIYRAKNNTFYRDGEPSPTENAYDLLSSELTIDTSLRPGYAGGLVGYFSHEGIQHLESSLSFNYARQFYDFEFGQYDDGLIFRPDAAPEYFYYENDRQAMYMPRKAHISPLKISYTSASKNDEQYKAMIEDAQKAIQNGRVFQVVLANRYEYRFTGDLLNLYTQLRRVNPSPFMFFLKFGNIVTLGASPELLAHTNSQHKVYLEALAGTIRRGQNEAEDQQLAERLLADEKEIAEHSMLVDLARNDVGRISKIGSVKIEDLMKIKRLSHVQHISSVISGDISNDKNAFDALAASFPAGTLSGAPKIESIKMIHELENIERGPYGGTIGYFSHNGESVHAVNIRSVSVYNDQLYLHSGSGVVYDSNAKREYEEISEKKAAMDRSMKPFMSKEHV